MCTVTFIPTPEKYIITSNRDEHISRPYSFKPKEVAINGCKLLYPMDPKAGGTWFAINEVGSIGVLLNGAFKAHVHKGNYTMSRGLILLKVMSSPKFSFYIKSTSLRLTDIQPFTLVLFENNKLIEFRWDGTQKHFKELNTNQNHIWSSATLYSIEAVLHRKKMFDRFVNQNRVLDSADVIDFHSQNHGDYQNGFIINRPNGLKTFSITQAVSTKDKIVLNHSDLLNGEIYTCLMPKKIRKNIYVNSLCDT